MATKQLLSELFPGRVIEPQHVDEIPRGVSLVYVFCADDLPIVVGKGTFKRARVIFDDATHITRPHLKSLFVRLCHLYGRKGASYSRFVITCESDAAAKAGESQLHHAIGGNNRKIAPSITKALLQGLTPDTIPWLLLNQAIHSSFDGQDDLLRWWKKGLIHEHDWQQVKKRLQLP